jgi:hypothetical protein
MDALALAIGYGVMSAGGIALMAGIFWLAAEIVFRQVKTTALLSDFVKWKVQRAKETGERVPWALR